MSVGRNMARGGLLSLARLGAGVVRVKVLALALGVAGIGLYSLLLQLYATGVAIVSMSLALPIINLGRRPIVAGDFEEAGGIAGSALAIVAANAVVLLLLFAAFERPVLAYLGISGAAGVPIWPVLVGIVIGACSTSFWEGMSFLCDRFDTYVRVGIVGAIADTAFMASGAWFYGLRGAVLAIPLSSAAMFTAYALLMTRDGRARRVIAHLRFRWRNMPRLIAFSAVMFGTIGLTNVGLTVMRSRVLIDAGAVQNGYLQTATSLAAYILAFVMTGFWGHLHARAAAEGDTAVVRAELRRSLDLGLLIAFSGCGAAAILAFYLVPLFYSPAFQPASRLIVTYMPGELCFQLVSMLNAYQLTVSLRRIYLASNLAYVALLVTAGSILIPHLGAYGYVVAHIVAATASFVAMVVLGLAKGQIRLSFAVRAGGLLLLLAGTCLLIGLRPAAGTSPLLIAVLLLPYAASGAVVVARFLGRD
jgi:O-antigen/teichoic acid export membrane protein